MSAFLASDCFKNKTCLKLTNVDMKTFQYICLNVTKWHAQDFCVAILVFKVT